MKLFKRLILTLFVGILLMTSNASAIGGGTGVIPGSFWKINGTDISPVNDSWSVTIGTLNVGAILMTGNLDMGGFDILQADSIFGSTSLLPVRIGDASTTSHSLVSEDDMLVTGKLEIDGLSYVDSDMAYSDDVSALFGDSSDALIEYDAAQTPDAWFFGVSSDSRNFIIGEAADVDTDFANAQGVDPQLIIQSADATSPTQRIRMGHNQTNGFLAVDSGSVNIQGNLLVGLSEVVEDGGAVNILNMPVSSTPTAGTEESFTWQIDQTDHLIVYSEANSSGGLQNSSIRAEVRFEENQGADVASATNIAVGTDGNAFELTGTTKVDLISNLGYRDGSILTLICNESVTIGDAVATSGTNITILLAGSADFGCTADDMLTLMLSSTTATGQAWREVSRSAN